MNPPNNLLRFVFILQSINQTSSVFRHSDIVTKKFEMPMIAYLTRDEHQLITKFQQCISIRFIYISEAVLYLIAEGF